jgi:hypothetical protein
MPLRRPLHPVGRMPDPAGRRRLPKSGQPELTMAFAWHKLARRPDIGVSRPIPVPGLPDQRCRAHRRQGYRLGHRCRWRGWRRIARHASGQDPGGAKQCGGDCGVFHRDWSLPGVFARADTCARSPGICTPHPHRSAVLNASESQALLRRAFWPERVRNATVSEFLRTLPPYLTILAGGAARRSIRWRRERPGDPDPRTA